MYGGVGNTGGVLIGIMVIGVISNGLTLMHVDSNWQYVVKGVIILLAVYVDMMRQKKCSLAVNKDNYYESFLKKP